MRLVVVAVAFLVAQMLFIAPGSSVDVVERSRPIEASIRELHLQPIEETEYRVVKANIYHARRRLAPFQLCLPCKCCNTNAHADTMKSNNTSSSSTIMTNNTYCATMPCCFGIDCQLPDKPFGFCAFVPKTCNCTSCATAT